MERVSRILDHRGEPIKIRQLQQEQSARIGSLAREFENHPSRGITPGRLAGILASAEQGDLVEQNDLFEEMEEKDPHIYAELSKRKRALLGLDWQILPPRNASRAEETAAAQVDEWLRDMDDFEDHLFDMGDAIGKGFANLEMAWQRNQRYLLPSISHRPARWFTVHQDERNRLLLRNEGGQGEPLWPFGWISHVHKGKSGYVARAGLHRVLAWPFLFKNYSLRDLAEFLEIYGLPVRLGTYPAGATDQEKATLLNAVVSIGHNAAGIMPQGMAIDFKDAAKGQSDPFMAMLTWCEASQSKAILGGTLTTTAEATGMGSNLGDVHNEVRHDLLVSDARQFAGTLTRDLVWPLVALNIPGIAPDRAPAFRFITDQDEDLKARADRDKVLFDMGLRLSAEKVEEIYGEGYERFDTTAPERPPGTAAAKADIGQAGDYVEDATPVLGAAAEQTITGWLEQIRAMLDQADSLEEFQSMLDAAYDDLDSTALTQVMGEAFSAAHLAGMNDEEVD